jgi:two-component sensor histidine kinase/CHASE1-domain containing sensor protein
MAVVAGASRAAGLTRSEKIVFALGVLAGLALSAWIGHRSFAESRTIERLRFEASAAEHASKLRDHLAAREAIARAFAATFEPPAQPTPDALQRTGPRLLDLAPEVTSFVWIPRLGPADLPALFSALAMSGVPEPALLGAGGRRLDPAGVGPTILPVLDIVPADAANRRSLGLDLASLPLPRAALDAAEAHGDAVATAPLELVQLPGHLALVVYIPVQRGGDGAAPPAGYLGFSYRFDRLFGAERLRLDTSRLLGLAVRDMDAPQPVVVFQAGPPPASPLRTTQAARFGARSYELTYWPAATSGIAPLSRALAAGGMAAALVAVLLGAALHLALARRRLTAALAAREEVERQLRVVVEELNHRARNIIAVVGAIVSRSLRDGLDSKAATEAVTARIRAIAGANTLLAQSEWAGFRIGEVLRRSGLPFGDRVHLDGPDPLLQPGAAQGIVLAIHELWTNAAKHGALATEAGEVRVSAAIRDGLFHLVWQECGVATVETGRSGFGRQLLEQLVPQGLGGTGRLTATPQGIRYALEAPADRVADPVPHG